MDSLKYNKDFSLVTVSNKKIIYYVHNLKGGKEIDEALTSRWDWAHEEFGRAVRQEISRALRAK